MLAIVRCLACLVAFAAALVPALAQGTPPPAHMKQVADDLYFWFDFRGTNSIVWATADGVMVIDTQPHPVQARRLIAEVRRITDKPIRWAFNTQVHGDHFLGNSELKAIGATIIAQAHAAQLMERYWQKDLARRVPGFEKAGLDPKEVRFVPPDLTFEEEMTIEMAGRKVRLFYPGPGQDPGASYAHFPHARAVATSGTLTPRSMSNLMYTPSIDGWIKVLRQLQAMDVDVYLPGHGDLGRKSDVDEAVALLGTIQAQVRAARVRACRWPRRRER